MSLKEVLDFIINSKIQDIKLRREFWETQIEDRKKQIKQLKKEIREFKSDLIVDNELLKKYQETDFNDVLNKQTLTTQEELELIRRSHIPRE